MAIFRDEVIVLKSRDFKESDKLLVLFGRRRGKFSAIAKGIRKLSSRKRGHLETFSLCKVSCAEGKSIDIVIEADVVKALDTKDIEYEEYDRIGFAAFVLDRFIPFGTTENDIFDFWLEYFDTDHSSMSTRNFVLKTLRNLGFVSNEDIKDWIQTNGDNIRSLRTWVLKILDTI